MVAERQRVLYATAACMQDVRRRAATTESMFAPMQAAVAVLAKFDIQVGPQTPPST